MNLRDFDFPLPEHLIALKPAPKRDECRLLVLRGDGSLLHRRFHNIVDYLNEGDMLLLNNTRVQEARLEVFKPTGGRLNILLVRNVSDNKWEILCPKKYTGKITLNSGKTAEIEDGRHLIYSGTKEELLSAGLMPLPPYIKRRPTDMDKEWYQTVYAQKDGSIAAPTAGLHFTAELLNAIKDKGVLIRYLTLHVGKGTFMPLRTESVENHLMEPEYFEMSCDLTAEVKEVRDRGKRIVSVGTTTTRAIEGFISGRFRASGSANGLIKGTTDIFIYPGYTFKAVDALITNFHLPASTPLLLASAFTERGLRPLSGRKRLLMAYRAAVDAGYRFFSYGDAMLIT